MLKRINYHLALSLIVITCSCRESSNKSKTKIVVDNKAKAASEKGVEPNRETMINVSQLIAINDLSPELKILSQQEWGMSENQSFDIIDMEDLSCVHSFLLIKQGSTISNIIQIRENCDSDLSYYRHNWAEYKLISDTLFLIKVSEQIFDKSLVDAHGFIKSGAERHETPSFKVDTSYFYGTIKDLIKLKENGLKLIRGEDVLTKYDKKVDFE